MPIFPKPALGDPGITQLTGAVTAGPGTGPKVASIPAASIAPSKLTTAVPVERSGTDLADADATINPASDQASLYTLPQSVTLTQNRVVTLGTTGSPAAGDVVYVVRRDASNKTFTVKDDAATTLKVFAASPTHAQGAKFRFDGTHYTFVDFFYAV